MRINKPGRKSVSKAIAKQDSESQKTPAKQQWNQEQLQDAIRLKAYEIYAQRGYTQGNDMDDWLRAEQLVLGHGASV